MVVMTEEARTERRLDELNAKVDAGFERVDRKVDAGFERIDCKVDAGFERVDNDIREVRGEVRELRSEVTARIDSLQKTMILGYVAMSASIFGALLVVPH